MGRRVYLVFRLACAFVFGLCVAGPSMAQSLPDDTGKAEFVHNCLDCHSAGMVLRAKKTPDEWRRNVDDMAARGTDGSKEDMDKVVLYLIKHFSTEEPAPVSTPPPATPPPQSAGAQSVDRENSSLASLRIERHGVSSAASWTERQSLLATNQVPVAIRGASATPSFGRKIKGENVSEVARYFDLLPSFEVGARK